MQPTELETLTMREVDRRKVIHGVVNRIVMPWRSESECQPLFAR
jgi:hypothetical protein